MPMAAFMQLSDSPVFQHAATASLSSMRVVDRGNSEKVAAPANRHTRADIAVSVRPETKQVRREEEERRKGSIEECDPRSSFSSSPLLPRVPRGGSRQGRHGAFRIQRRTPSARVEPAVTARCCSRPSPAEDPARDADCPRAPIDAAVLPAARRCPRAALIDSELRNGCSRTTCCYKETTTGTINLFSSCAPRANIRIEGIHRRV
ncbi:hypothetical protein MTO96_009374 [Rhipicephalus appendiculatus]